MISVKSLRYISTLSDCIYLYIMTEYILPVFKATTLLFSKKGTSNLCDVLPAMESIEDTLSSNIKNIKFHPSIRAALQLAQKTLNHYYTKMDLLMAYCIAMHEWSKSNSCSCAHIRYV